MLDQNLEPKVIYETDDFLAVDKPAGLMVHPAKVRVASREPEPTVVDWLLAKRPEVKNVGDDPATRPGIVHRLDKETSGIMLIPKTQAYFEYLKSLFQKHEIKKTYLAIVRGVPKNKTGTIDTPIGIMNGTLKRSVRSKKMSKEAITEYHILREWELKEDSNARIEKQSLLEVFPKTGRTHQIRVHLASIGHPIVGDKLYGPKQKIKDKQPATRLMLHAASIEFREKDGRLVKLSTHSPFAPDA
jgi:23S rRNA pseudouridine1911/1915/1917 synthase